MKKFPLFFFLSPSVSPDKGMVFAIHIAKSSSLPQLQLMPWTCCTWATGFGSLSQYVAAFDFAALKCLDEEDLGEEVDLIFFLLGFLGTWPTPADGIPW